MWSGPRTVSTAMMRAWENRPDTVVFDEPLYSFYLSSLPELDHPGRDEVIASQPASWQAVLSSLADDPLPPGVTIAYAKHMTHHVLPSVDLAAFAPFRHAFLIRDPRSLLASYAKVRSAPTRADLGLRQQAWLYEEFGGPVIDSTDLLAAPEAGLRALCAALGVPFSAAMLSWPAGPRPSDGVWAPHWYDNVWRSTGFTGAKGPPPPLDPALEPLLAECLPYYERLSENKIKIETPNVGVLLRGRSIAAEVRRAQPRPHRQRRRAPGAPGRGGGVAVRLRRAGRRRGLGGPAADQRADLRA